MTFSTLYKKTNTGAIQSWTVSVDDTRIITYHGQHMGKLQKTEDTIKEGKNAGRANATTAQEQANAEAKAKWEKQKKKGYVEHIEWQLEEWVGFVLWQEWCVVYGGHGRIV